MLFRISVYNFEFLYIVYSDVFGKYAEIQKKYFSNSIKIINFNLNVYHIYRSFHYYHKVIAQVLYILH